MTQPTERRISYFYTTDRDQPVVKATGGGQRSDLTAGSDLHVGDVFGALHLHRVHDLWVATDDPDRHVQESIRQLLLAKRCSVDDAEEWAYRNWRTWLAIPLGLTEPEDRWVVNRVTSIATAYWNTGMPADEAFGWAIRSVNANYAIYLRGHGWNPDTYGSLTSLCIQAAAPEDEGQWVEAGVVWWRALRYLQAGVSLPEAIELESRRLAGEDIDGAVDVLLGLTSKGDTI